MIILPSSDIGHRTHLFTPISSQSAMRPVSAYKCPYRAPSWVPGTSSHTKGPTRHRQARPSPTGAGYKSRRGYLRVQSPAAQLGRPTQCSQGSPSATPWAAATLLPHGTQHSRCRPDGLTFTLNEDEYERGLALVSSGEQGGKLH